MAPNVGRVNSQLAMKQWNTLHEIISTYATVEVIEQVDGLPDMVFTANAGLCIPQQNLVVTSVFSKSQRTPEQQVFYDWFASRKMSMVSFNDKDCFFEGAGDALIDDKNQYWMGHGQRSSLHAIDVIQCAFPNIRCFPLALVTPEFYHLDTCFCPLSGGEAIVHEKAFGFASYATILEHIGDVILVTDDDAERFACNAVEIDRNIIVNEISDNLKQQLKDRGYNPITVDLSEFIKAGGAAKCLTLQLN